MTLQIRFEMVPLINVSKENTLNKIEKGRLILIYVMRERYLRQRIRMAIWSESKEEKNGNQISKSSLEKVFYN